MSWFLAILATLSIWDYPSRHPSHERLRTQFVSALRIGDAKTMESVCRRGVSLLPEDPVWHYNLACSLAHFGSRENEALDALEHAIDLGFRDAEAIAKDPDLRQLVRNPRYDEMLDYAKQLQSRPLMIGPLAAVDATGPFGASLALGEQNLGWDFDFGCFVAKMKLSGSASGGNVGDLYMNRDAGHSVLKVAEFPGLTAVRLDRVGRERGMDVDFPNILFPYPVFGNASRAFVQNVYWRSIPRALMTLETRQLKKMVRFYLTNQTWVFPANADIGPAGTNGDVFASIAPYWMTTAGCSYSDLPYLKAALSASRAFPPTTKTELIKRGLLAPTIQTLIRKSLKGVTDETDYLSAKAHPTAFPVGGVELARLEAAARALKPEAIPPLAVLVVSPAKTENGARLSEVTYGTAFAWAFVLRAEDPERKFVVKAAGATDYAFVQTHGAAGAVTIERLGKDAARLTVRRAAVSPTNRVDVAVFGRNPGTAWGAPSYISFARMDPAAPYSDPALTPLPKAEKK